MSVDGDSVFVFLFRLSRDASSISLERFLRRLVNGLANHFNAATCSIYLDDASNMAARAESSVALDDLVEAQAEDLRRMEAQVVAKAFETGDRVSALDVEAGSMPPAWDVFAFPLNTSEGTRAVGVLFFDENSTSITDREMQALLAVGEILELGQDESWTGAGQDDDIPDLGPEVDPVT